VRGLSEDPEVAFVQCERIARESLNTASTMDASTPLTYGDPEPHPNGHYFQYMAAVSAAVSIYSIDELSDLYIPSPGDFDTDVFQRFRFNVDIVTNRLRLKNSKHLLPNSVAFDDAARNELRFHLAQMRDVVDKWDVTEDKKHLLFADINRLNKSIDQEHTPLEHFTKLAMKVCRTAGEASKGLDPLIDRMVRIGSIFDDKRESQEGQAKLPNPGERKKIEAPKPQKPKSIDWDTEIPF